MTIDNLFGFVGAIISKVVIADGSCKVKSIRLVKAIIKKVFKIFGIIIKDYTILVIILSILEWSGEYLGYMLLWLLAIFIKVIFPLFGKCFMPLAEIPEGDLKSELQTLLKQQKFPVKYLFMIKGEKNSQAFFYGFGIFKCIVLSEGLVNSTINCKPLGALSQFSNIKKMSFITV